MATEAAENIAETLLKQAHPPDISSTIFREKVKQRPLLLRPSSPDPKRDARSKRQYERQRKANLARKSKKSKPLSAKQKRALCVYDIPKEQQKYAIYEPLYAMWCTYMRGVLALSDGKRNYVDANGAGQMLVSADYHGALVEVVRSRCVDRVGLKGIVVKDTKFTYEIVTVEDELKTVPKEHTIFRFELPLAPKDGEAVQKPLSFEIHGSRFENRAPDRANKKFRAHFDPDL